MTAPKHSHVEILRVSVSHAFASAVLTSAIEAPYTRQWATIQKRVNCPKGFATRIVLIDQEADADTPMKDRRHTITATKLQRAIGYMICNWRDCGLENTRIVGMFLSDNVDGVAADVALQVACFKKVIYG